MLRLGMRQKFMGLFHDKIENFQISKIFDNYDI